MKILIAEDEPIMLKTMELKLRRDGHQVITANNGRDPIQLPNIFTRSSLRQRIEGAAVNAT